MITKAEIAEIMELTTRQLLMARESAVESEKSRLRRLLSNEIKDNLDPEWNYAMKRALELLDDSSAVIHPVLSASEIARLTEQVAAKIERLGIRHE